MLQALRIDATITWPDKLREHGAHNLDGNPYTPTYQLREFQRAIDRGGEEGLLAYMHVILDNPDFDKLASDGWTTICTSVGPMLTWEGLLVLNTQAPYSPLFTSSQRLRVRRAVDASRLR
jgi:hypothetical protein